MTHGADTASADVTWDGYGVAVADTTENGDHLGLQFERLRTRTFRTMIAWNAPPIMVQQVTNRINAARARGATQILVSMDHDGTRSRPTAAAYEESIDPIVDQLAPLVDYWGPANEPNCVWLTGRNPDGAQRAAEFYLAMEAVKQANDPTAGLLSPDFCDYYSGNSLVPYITAYQAAGGGWGDVTAWHPYWGIHRRDLASTNEFIAASTAAPDGAPADHPIWITESGGFISYPGRAITGTQDSQLGDAEWMIHTLGAVPQVKRIYYYDMQAGNPSWDTALVDEGGLPRKAWFLWCWMSHGGDFAAADCQPRPGESAPDPPGVPDPPGGVVPEPPVERNLGGVPPPPPATGAAFPRRPRTHLMDALTARRAQVKRGSPRRARPRHLGQAIAGNPQWMRWSRLEPD